MCAAAAAYYLQDAVSATDSRQVIHAHTHIQAVSYKYSSRFPVVVVGGGGGGEAIMDSFQMDDRGLTAKQHSATTWLPCLLPQSLIHNPTYNVHILSNIHQVARANRIPTWWYGKVSNWLLAIY